MYSTKVYLPQGGEQLVVADGGNIQVMTGGQILPNSGIQAVVGAGTDISEVEGVMTAAERQAFNDVLAALRGVGIITPIPVP
jgi:hypothetical protein